MPVSCPPLLPAFGLALLFHGLASAATLSVTVNDAAGRPLPDAVVMLEPTSGRLPVKPMTAVEVGQMARQFTPAVTIVTVGTPVNFPNHDTVRHHVYSFSPAKTFELKLYAGVPATPVVFDKPGVAVLGCNIHDQMAAWIVVVDTPHFARTAAGPAHLAGIPPGTYRLKAWHPALPADMAPQATMVTLGTDDQSATMRLATRVTP